VCVCASRRAGRRRPPFRPLFSPCCRLCALPAHACREPLYHVPLRAAAHSGVSNAFLELCAAQTSGHVLRRAPNKYKWAACPRSELTGRRRATCPPAAPRGSLQSTLQQVVCGGGRGAMRANGGARASANRAFLPPPRSALLGAPCVPGARFQEGLDLVLLRNVHKRLAVGGLALRVCRPRARHPGEAHRTLPRSRLAGRAQRGGVKAPAAAYRRRC